MISVLSMVYVVPKSTRIHCGQGEAAQRVAVSPSTAWEASLPACWLENVTGLFKARLVVWVTGFAITDFKPRLTAPAISTRITEICIKTLVAVFISAFSFV